jgi:hypothetical protein
VVSRGREVTRGQVLAYRLAAQGLLRDGTDAVLGLGVQDSPPGSARAALAARGLDAGGLAAAWTFRGAPHLHRPGDLRRLATGLRPLDEPDAVARLAGLGATLTKAGRSAIEAYDLAAGAVRDALAGPATTGELSAAVTRLLPEHLSAWCRGCGATHVHEQLLRLAVLPGGGRLVPGTAPPVIEPVPRWRGVPARPEGTAALLAAYLAVLGPAGPAEVAGHLGTTRAAVGPVWPRGLAQVSVDGRPAWIPDDRLGALLAARRVGAVRLLPPSDPWLQARDRELVVPGAARRKQLWRVLGSPGAVLAGGEVVASWRATAGRAVLDVAVTPFGPLPGRVRAEVEREAERLAAVRGAGEARVSYG